MYVKYDYETGPRTTFERIFVSKYRSGDRFPVVVYKQRVRSKRQTIANVLTLISWPVFHSVTEGDSCHFALRRPCFCLRYTIMFVRIAKFAGIFLSPGVIFSSDPFLQFSTQWSPLPNRIDICQRLDLYRILVKYGYALDFAF